MSTLNVVEEVLRERRVPMVVREIVEAAGERLPTKSRTPDTVVARDLSMDIKRRGAESLFIRTSPGRYSLKELVVAGVVEMAAATDSVAENDVPPANADVPVELLAEMPPPDLGSDSVQR